MLEPSRPRRIARAAVFVALTSSPLAACQIIIGVEDRRAAETSDGGPDSPGAQDGASDTPIDVDATMTSSDGGCDRFKPFGTPEPLSAANSVDGEFGATLSLDELELLYTTTTPGSALVHRATRARRDLPFGPGSVVDELRTIPTPHWGVSLSPDGTTLYVTAGPPPRNIYRVVRVSPSGAFGASQLLTFPGWKAFQAEDQVFVTASGLLYIGLQSGPQYDLYVSPLDDAGVNKTPTPLVFFNTMGGSEAWPVESADGFAFYYAAGDGTSSEIIESRRSSLSTPFPMGTALSFPTSPRKHPLWASADGCRLYLAQDNATGGGGGSDLWVATRPP